MVEYKAYGEHALMIAVGGISGMAKQAEILDVTFILNQVPQRHLVKWQNQTLFLINELESGKQHGY